MTTPLISMTFQTIDPHGSTKKPVTYGELASLILTREKRALSHMAVGDCVGFKRDFGNGSFVITRIK